MSWLTGAASHLIGAPLSGLPARTQATVRLPIGSTLPLYTDGLVEGRVDGRRPDLDEGRQRLSRFVAALPDNGPEALCDRVVDELVSDQHDDDIALFAVQVRQPAGAAPLTDQGSKPEHEDLVRTADRALRLAHLWPALSSRASSCGRTCCSNRPHRMCRQPLHATPGAATQWSRTRSLREPSTWRRS